MVDVAPGQVPATGQVVELVAKHAVLVHDQEMERDGGQRDRHEHSQVALQARRVRSGWGHGSSHTERRPGCTIAKATAPARGTVMMSAQIARVASSRARVLSATNAGMANAR